MEGVEGVEGMELPIEIIEVDQLNSERAVILGAGEECREPESPTIPLLLDTLNEIQCEVEEKSS